MELPIPNQLSQLPGGGLVAALRGVNSLVNDYYNTQRAKSEAEYAPYNNYANALSKLAYANYTPYQIQSQILSNPLTAAAFEKNPQAFTQLLNNLSTSIPNMQDITSQSNIPIPSKMNSQGLLQHFWDKITGNNHSDSVNALLNSPAEISHFNNNYSAPNFNNENIDQNDGKKDPQYNPLLPRKAGLTAAIIGSKMATFNKSPNKPGDLIYDDKTGKTISVPEQKVASQLQQQITSSQRLIPQINKLSKAWEPFIGLKGDIYRGFGTIAGYLGKESDAASKYAYAKQKSFDILEGYLKSQNVPMTVDAQEKLRDIIEPQIGETPKSYRERLINQVNDIKEDFVNPSKKQLEQGITLNSDEKPINNKNNNINQTENNSAPTEDDILFTAEKYNMTPEQVKKLLGIK
jgi:hypothetical protein